MLCPNCGKESNGAPFCPECGTPLPTESAADSMQQAASQPVYSEQPDAPTANTASVYSDHDDPMDFGEQNNAAYSDSFGNSAAYPDTSTSAPSAYPAQAAAVAELPKRNILKPVIITGAVVLTVGVIAAIVLIVMNMLNSTRLMKEHPTEFLAQSFAGTARNMVNNDEMLTAMQPESRQRTERYTIISGEDSVSATVSFDRTGKKLYAGVNSSNGTSLELYSDVRHHVLVGTSPNASIDYFVNSENLREQAVSSVFGPGGMLGVSQESYDAFMDVYEYMYTNMLKPDEEMFALAELGKKICADIDECGSVTVTDGKVDVDGVVTDADIISYVFTDTTVFDRIYVDVKDWADQNINFNEDARKAILEAIKSMDPLSASSQLNNQSFKLTLTCWLNKNDHSVMQAEASYESGEDQAHLAATFGAVPAESKKFTMNFTSNMKNDSDAAYVVENLSDSTNDKYVVTSEVGGKTSSTEFVRDRATGDFTLTTRNAGDSSEKTYSGNLRYSADSYTMKIHDYYGKGVDFEYYVSNKAEIRELTSSNDLLDITQEDINGKVKTFGEEIGESFSAVVTKIFMSAYSDITDTQDYFVDPDSDYDYLPDVYYNDYIEGSGLEESSDSYN